MRVSLEEMFHEMNTCGHNIRNDFEHYFAITKGQIEGAFELLGVNTMTGENLDKAAITMLSLLRFDALKKMANEHRGFSKVMDDIRKSARGRTYDYSLTSEEFTKILEYAVRQDLTEDPDFAVLLAAYLSVIMLKNDGNNHRATKTELLKTLCRVNIRTAEVQSLVPVFLLLWNVENIRGRFLKNRKKNYRGVRGRVRS